MASNLVISGGPLHDYESTTAALVDILEEHDVESTVFDDPGAALEILAEEPHRWDLVTVNALHCQLPAARHAELRAQWSFHLSDRQSKTLHRYVSSGGGLLACHTAVICFDADPRWSACVGATWNWQRSSHPPLGPARIVATGAGRSHPITSATTEFTTIDEVYGSLDLQPDLIPLLTSTHGGSDHPVMWARRVGSGRVVTDLLGHDAQAVRQPDHRNLLGRCANWLTAIDPSETSP